MAGMIENTFEGALTDAAELTCSTKKCRTVLCEPVWVIPLPVPDDAVYLEIAVEELPDVLFFVPLK